MSTSSPESPASSAGSTSRFAFRLPAMQEAGLLGVVAVLMIGLSLYGYYDAPPGAANRFLNPSNLIDGIATQMSYYAIMAIGLTLVIVTGGIDISVGSVMALSGLMTAWTLEQFAPGTSPLLMIPLSLAVPLGVGLTCGLINGALIVGLRMHPFIVTLGTLSIFRGLCNVLPFGSATLPKAGAPLPDWSVTHLFRETLFGQYVWPMIVTLIVVAIGYVFLRFTVAGRETYAVGGNEEAARFSGIRVGRAKLRVYAISGTLAGLAGLISLGKFSAVSTNTAEGYELTVVAAAVVGGASLMGGRGTAIGALLGALILALIDNAINILRFDQQYQRIIVGACIIIAVALDSLGTTWRNWRLRRRANAAIQSRSGHA